MTPLMEAASAKRDSEQHEETVKVLLENGAVRQTHVSELMFQPSKLKVWRVPIRCRTTLRRTTSMATSPFILRRRRRR